MPLKRLLAAADRHLLRRAHPHGLISWRYLVPDPPPTVRIHRQLWLMGRHPRLPLPLYLVMELLLWLRWVTFSGLRQSWRAFRLQGAESRAPGEGGAMARLARLLALSIGHCMPPGEICAFGLHRFGAGRAAWEYVFVIEVGAFHRWRNAEREGVDDALVLVQDKQRLASYLEGHGIHMVPTLVLVRRGEAFDPTPYLPATPRLFCKPRHGSASRDAFVIEHQGQGETPALFSVLNGMKGEPATVETLRIAMMKDDFLVQPLLENHPDLARLCCTDDAVTVRVITEHCTTRGTRSRCATLEIPAAADRCHIILAIDPSGRAFLPSTGWLSAQAKAGHDAALALLGEEPVPFWDDIVRSAMAAHRLLPGLYAIAWDFIVTPTGPVMLEGNSCWGTMVPQLLQGGLLHDAIAED